MGLIGEELRLPLVRIDTALKETLKNALKEYGLI
jgi:hypothetical protein